MNMLAAAEKGQRIDYIYCPGARQVYLCDDTATRPSIDLTSIDLSGFVEGACSFFATHGRQTASVGSPYVSYADPAQTLEFTAAIRVVGDQTGTIYFSASRAMLTIMLMRMGAAEITHDNMCMLMRQIAAQMATVARRAIGADFVVRETNSVARHTLARGKAQRALVVPIQWRKFTAKLVLCMA